MKNLLPVFLLLLSGQLLAANGGSGGGNNISADIMGQSRTPRTPQSTSGYPRDILKNSSIVEAQPSRLNTFLRIPKHDDGCEADVCENETPAPHDHVGFGISFIKFGERTNLTPPGSKVSDCKCLTDKLSVGLTEAQLIEAKNAERKKINDIILKSYSEKFTNDFSNNIEDLSFFLNQSRDMFADQSVALGYQCTDGAKFDDEIKKVCGARQVTDENFIKERKDLFMNAYRNQGGSFDEKIGSLDKSIVDADLTTYYQAHKRPNDPPLLGTITRKVYDSTRMQTMKDDPETKAFNKIISTIFSDFDLNKKLNDALAMTSPADALVKVINDNKEKLSSVAGAGPYLKTLEEIHASIRFLMYLHPGYKLAFKNKDAFAKLRAAQSAEPNVSLLTIINDRPVLESFVGDKCAKIIKEFANAVCTKDQDLISAVDSKDLETLIHSKANDSAPGTKMHELLICEAKKGMTISGMLVPGLSGLANALNGNPEYRQSDYVALSGSPLRDGAKERLSATGGHAVGIGALTIAVNTNPDARVLVGALVDKNEKTRTGFSGPGIAANYANAQAVLSGRAMPVGQSSMSKEDARKYLAESRQYDKDRALAKANNQPASTSTAQNADTEVSKPLDNLASPSSNPVSVPGTIAPSTNYASNAAATGTSNYTANAREALKNYIADKNNVSDVDRAVSGLSDSDANELNRLRKEKTTLLEDQLKEGEARLKDLRDQFSNAASKVNSPVPDRNIASVEDDQNSDEGESSFDSSSSGRNPRSIDQRTALGGGSASGNQSSASVGGASTGSTQSGSVISSNKVQKEAAETEAQVANSPNTQGDISGSVIITAADVKASATLPATELNQEVQKFLASSTLSSASIQDIKSKGIKIRFNVMENNKLVQKEVVVKYESLDQETRNQIDLKLARNNVKNQISKLAVLKLLISKSTNR